MNSECIICFEFNESIYFDCSHCICLQCYEKLLQKDVLQCPICRKVIDVQVGLHETIETVETVETVETETSGECYGKLACFIFIGAFLLAFFLETK